MIGVIIVVAIVVGGTWWIFWHTRAKRWSRWVKAPVMGLAGLFVAILIIGYAEEPSTQNASGSARGPSPSYSLPSNTTAPQSSPSQTVAHTASSKIMALRAQVTEHDSSVHWSANETIGHPTKYIEDSSNVLVSSILGNGTPQNSPIIMYYTLMRTSPHHYQYVSYTADDKYPKDIVLISQADYAISQAGVLETNFIEDASGTAKATPTDLTVLPMNLTVGTTWHNIQPSETDDYTVLGLATVTTYAGTFQHCLVLLEQEHVLAKDRPVIIDTAIFDAPGIGTVKSEAWGGIPFTVGRDAVKISYPSSPPPLTHQAIPLNGSVFPAVMSWQNTSPSPSASPSPSTTPSPSSAPSTTPSPSPSGSPPPSSSSTQSYGNIDGYSIQTPASNIQNSADLSAMAQQLQKSWNMSTNMLGWEGNFSTGWQYDGMHLTFTPDEVLVPPSGENGFPLVDWVVTVTGSGSVANPSTPPSDYGQPSPATYLTVALNAVGFVTLLDEGEQLDSTSAANSFLQLEMNGLYIEITLANKQGDIMQVMNDGNNSGTNSTIVLVNLQNGTNSNESAWLTQTINDH